MLSLQLQDLFDGLFQFFLGNHAGDLIGNLTVFEKNQGGDGLNAIFAGAQGVFIHIDLGERHLIPIGFFQCLNGRCNGFAGTTPGRPEIDMIGFSDFNTVSSNPSSSISMILSVMTVS
jgi:hypothetical protein